MLRWLPVLVAITALSLSACSAKSQLIHRPTDTSIDAAITDLWVAEIRRTARDGDWLLSRAYYATSDLIVLGTRGEALSHGSIYDATRGTVIESIASGVREIPLAQFVARNHIVIVVRPSKMTAADGGEAIARARTKVGAPFDAAGMFGVDDPDRFYCSELVYWASQTAARTGSHELVVTPSDLMKYGEVIYWSGERDDAAVGKLALERRRAMPRTAATR
jgi:Permuted papain-like amidase enzyme, YaeF/YiiX, C92 family